MVYIPGLPSVYHGVLVIPNNALTSIMACRVYRNMKLGITRGPELSLPTLNSLDDSRDPNIPLSVVRLSTQGNGITSSLVRSQGEGSDFIGNKHGMLNPASEANI